MNKNTKEKEVGILYITTSDRNFSYLDSAIESAKSAKKHMEKINCQIFTDKIGIEYLKSFKSLPYDKIEEIQNPHYRSKVDYLSKTQYKKTLYLDSDTR